MMFSDDVAMKMDDLGVVGRIRLRLFMVFAFAALKAAPPELRSIFKRVGKAGVENALDTDD